MNFTLEAHMRPFMKPITNFIYETPLAETIYQKQLESKISEFGFPAEPIIKLLQEFSETTYLTGSFLLHYLSQPSTWVPSDIDIFTSEPEFVSKLLELLNEHDVEYIDDNVDSDQESKNEYSYTTNGEIESVHEWITNTKPSKKLQVILVGTLTEEVIDDFDFTIVKSKFNGYRLTIPEETIKSILTKTDYIKSYHETDYHLERTIDRSIKYSKRGYKILYPTVVKLDSYCEYNCYRSVDDLYENISNTTLICRKDITIETYDPTS